jgi:hypothetical protein
LEPIFASDATIGAIIGFSVNFYGNHKPTEVVTGFDVNHKIGWSALGPMGLAFDSNDDGTLYAVDGIDNTLVSFNNAADLLEANEIIVKRGGKTFKCKFPKRAGGNTLVELTPNGHVLDTRVVDTRLTQGIFSVRAAGSNDGDTVLYYTDTNDNSLHELER